MIPRETIDEILNRADIVEVVSGYVPLKRAGANFRALCPFHQEKTPSFNVNPDKRIFHCFGCGEGGNSIGFVMKMESVSFPEAARILARKYGVAIQERPGAGGGKPGQTERIYAAMESAAKFYRKALEESAPDSPQARYVAKRGVTRPVQELFGLGWAPDRWDALTGALLAEGFDKAILETAGLAKVSSTGGLIDRFRARVIFPIKDMQGRPIAFGGRALAEDAGGPKYLNSPETPIYNKSRVLYGLNMAAPSARRENHLIVVEGYMDVIALRQAGIENCAAVSGTAFTPSQAEVIKRICDTVTAFFDSDEAGAAAAKKSLPILLEKDLKAKVFSLPGAKDADEYLKEHGPEDLLSQLRMAPYFPQFVIDRATAQVDLASVEGRSKAARDALPYINRISDPIERDQYLQILAEKTRLDLASLKKELTAMARGAAPEKRPALAPARAPAVKKKGVREAAERILIRILLDRPDYIYTVAGGLAAGDLGDEENRALYKLIAGAADGGAKTLDGVMAAAGEGELAGKVAGRIMEADMYDEAGAEKAARDAVAALKRRPEERKRLLKDQVSAAEGADREKYEEAKKKYIDSRKDNI